MPVRAVSNRGGNTIGSYPSLKLGRMVRYESLIERDFISVLDFEPAVSWFEEQPLTVNYQVGQKSRRYTPDFHLIQAGQPILVECKPHRQLTAAENRPKFAAARAWCAAQGWRFRLVTEVELATSQRVQNILHLTRFAHYPLAPAFRQRVAEALQGLTEPVPLAAVMAQVEPEGPPRALIPLLAMIYHHHLSAPLDQAPLSTQTKVSLRAEEGVGQ